MTTHDHAPSSRAVLAGYVLPGDVSLTHAFSTIFQGLRASGCGLAAANAWLFLARSTSPAAWFESGRLPINWRKHATLALEIGVSERRLNQVVHELATHGALTRLTPENGYRGYVPGEAEGGDLERSYGLCFGPAIRKFAAFAEAAEAERRRRVEIAQIKEELRAAKGELRDRLKTLAALDVVSPLADEAGTLLASLPSTGCRNRNSDGMPEHTATARELVQRLDTAIEAASGGGHTPSHRKESAHACGENFRCQYNPTPENQKDVHVIPYRHASNIHSTNPNPAKDTNPSISQKGSGTGDHGQRIDPDEKQGSWPARPDTGRGQTLLTVNLSKEAVIELLTDDLRTLFEAEPKDLPWSDRLRTACNKISRRLGVHPSVWDGAVRVLGSLVACVCLAIIDRNRFHPSTPTRNPGGLLRSMIRQAQCGGSLNLDASIWAIWERERHGQQPKSGPWTMVRSSPAIVLQADDDGVDAFRRELPESRTPAHAKALEWWEALPAEERDAAFVEFAVTGEGDDHLIRNETEIIEAAGWYWGGIPYPRAKRSSAGAKTKRLVFPAQGGLKYAAEKNWYRICRQETNRSNEIVADKFRSWAKRNNIPLDHIQIEATFRRFCRKLGDV
ncbi:MAG: replication initiation protein RepC [Rhodobacteraceae bacterium]|nr:replication initiation protein RepC [Paracoccaceae bacterium]